MGSIISQLRARNRENTDTVSSPRRSSNSCCGHSPCSRQCHDRDSDDSAHDSPSNSQSSDVNYPKLFVAPLQNPCPVVPAARTPNPSQATCFDRSSESTGSISLHHTSETPQDSGPSFTLSPVSQCASDSSSEDCRPMIGSGSPSSAAKAFEMPDQLVEKVDNDDGSYFDASNS